MKKSTQKLRMVFNPPIFRTPKLAAPIEYTIGYLLSIDLFDKIGDGFTWYALTSLIEFILDVTKNSPGVLTLIIRSFEIFENSKSDEIYRLARLVNNTHHPLSHKIRAKSYQIEIEEHCKNNETDDVLLNVVQAYLILESETPVKLCAQIMSTLKCLSHVPDAFLIMAIDYIDKTEFDQTLDRVSKCQKIILLPLFCS